MTAEALEVGPADVAGAGPATVMSGRLGRRLSVGLLGARPRRKRLAAPLAAAAEVRVVPSAWASVQEDVGLEVHIRAANEPGARSISMRSTASARLGHRQVGDQLDLGAHQQLVGADVLGAHVDGALDAKARSSMAAVIFL